MMIEERQMRILEELKKTPDLTVRELAKLLAVSEPTVRRDFTELHQKGFITKRYGGAILNMGAADREIPFLLREQEKSSVKTIMGAKAAELVRDGMVVMLDGSTSAYHLVPYLSRFKDLIVITNGAKTAVSLAEHGVRTFCTGGQMITRSFCYVGEQAESFVKTINADLFFFSCHGLSASGQMTDRAIEEANLRKVMFASCAQKVLLCDSSKFGKTYFYNMGNLCDINALITEGEIPTEYAAMLRQNQK